MLDCSPVLAGDDIAAHLSEGLSQRITAPALLETSFSAVVLDVSFNYILANVFKVENFKNCLWIVKFASTFL